MQHVVQVQMGVGTVVVNCVAGGIVLTSAVSKADFARALPIHAGPTFVTAPKPAVIVAAISEVVHQSTATVWDPNMIRLDIWRQRLVRLSSSLVAAMLMLGLASLGGSSRSLIISTILAATVGVSTLASP
jgi:hypothetical protein